MITVYYAKVFPFLEEDTFLSDWNKIDKVRQEKIRAVKNPDAGRRSLAAGCLLHDALCEKLELSTGRQIPFSIGYEADGKPYLTQRPDVHFNVSHSGDYVCCAISDVPVGVDIQKEVPAGKNLAERFFTPADCRELSECDENDREHLFFRMWSIKESFIKMTGKGMRQGIASFEIDWHHRWIWEKEKKMPSACFTEYRHLPGYSFCVCAEKAGQEVVWREILRK